MKNKKLILSNFLIIFAFFLGYTFAQRQEVTSQEKLKNQEEYVNIIIKKKSLEFISSSSTIKVLVNGQENQTGSITLE